MANHASPSPNEDKNIAVIYARFSTHNQREESIEQQVDECRAFAAQNGLEVIDVYADKAVSGRKETRAAYQRMIHDAEKKKFNAIIAYKSSRIARNMLNGLQLEVKLANYGVALVYAKEEFGNNAAGRFALRSMMNVNQFYSENLAEDIMRGMEDNAKMGKRNGGAVPFGYCKGEDGKYQADPERAEVVREIYTRVRDGEHVQAIIDSLNKRGIKTALKNEWVLNSMNRLLHNEKYIGIYTWNGVRIDGAMPRILDDKLFYEVQKAMDSRSTRGRYMNADDYILTGRLFCGMCGDKMVGVSGTSRRGKVYRYYDCSGRRAKRCKKSPVRKDWIEEEVARIIREHVLCDETIAWLADEAMRYQENSEERQRLETLKIDFANASVAVENILVAIEQGVCSKALTGRLSEHETTKEKTAKEISRLSALTTRFTRDQIVAYFNSFRDGDVTSTDVQKKLILQFVGVVYVYDDELRIGFNYSARKEPELFKIVREDSVRSEGQPVHQADRTPPYTRRGSFFDNSS